MDGIAYGASLLGIWDTALLLRSGRESEATALEAGEGGFVMNVFHKCFRKWAHVPQGLKPLNLLVFLARLKPCPDENRLRDGFI